MDNIFPHSIRLEGEYPIMYYVNDHYTILTNRRLFQIKNGKMMLNCELENAIDVFHINNGIFQNDEILVKYKNYTMSFPIYSKNICHNFVEEIKKLII